MVLAMSLSGNAPKTLTTNQNEAFPAAATCVGVVTTVCTFWLGLVTAKARTSWG